jgi:hypothetical protein
LRSTTQADEQPESPGGSLWGPSQTPKAPIQKDPTLKISVPKIRKPRITLSPSEVSTPPVSGIFQENATVVLEDPPLSLRTRKSQLPTEVGVRWLEASDILLDNLVEDAVDGKAVDENTLLEITGNEVAFRQVSTNIVPLKPLLPKPGPEIINSTNNEKPAEEKKGLGARWTAEEDDRLIHYRTKTSLSYPELEKSFPGRPASTLRYRWHILRGRRNIVMPKPAEISGEFIIREGRMLRQDWSHITDPKAKRQAVQRDSYYRSKAKKGLLKGAQKEKLSQDSGNVRMEGVHKEVGECPGGPQISKVLRDQSKQQKRGTIQAKESIKKSSQTLIEEQAFLQKDLGQIQQPSGSVLNKESELVLPIGENLTNTKSTLQVGSLSATSLQTKAVKNSQGSRVVRPKKLTGQISQPTLPGRVESTPKSGTRIDQDVSNGPIYVPDAEDEYSAYESHALEIEERDICLSSKESPNVSSKQLCNTNDSLDLQILETQSLANQTHTLNSRYMGIGDIASTHNDESLKTRSRENASSRKKMEERIFANGGPRIPAKQHGKRQSLNRSDVLTKPASKQAKTGKSSQNPDAITGPKNGSTITYTSQMIEVIDHEGHSKTDISRIRSRISKDQATQSAITTPSHILPNSQTSSVGCEPTEAELETTSIVGRKALHQDKLDRVQRRVKSSQLLRPDTIIEGNISEKTLGRITAKDTELSYTGLEERNIDITEIADSTAPTSSLTVQLDTLPTSSSINNFRNTQAASSSNSIKFGGIVNKVTSSTSFPNLTSISSHNVVSFRQSIPVSPTVLIDDNDTSVIRETSSSDKDSPQVECKRPSRFKGARRSYEPKRLLKVIRKSVVELEMPKEPSPSKKRKFREEIPSTSQESPLQSSLTFIDTEDLFVRTPDHVAIGDPQPSESASKSSPTKFTKKACGTKNAPCGRRFCFKCISARAVEIDDEF